MAGNLSRDEAASRARLLSVHSYAVELDFTRDDDRFTSRTTVTFDCSEPGAVTFIDLAVDEVTRVILNGREASPVCGPGGKLTLPPLASQNELKVTASCRYSTTGEGLHRFTDPVDGETYLYTHFEPAEAHRVYACFDQPDLKASFELLATVPPGWRVVSTNAPDVAGDGGRWHFPATPPLPPYATVVAAGPYHAIRDDSGDVPVAIYCRKCLADFVDPEEIFAIARQGLDFYQEQLGRRYAFGKCDFVFVPEFNSGAMENAAAITFAEDFIFRSRVTDATREERAEIMLHEMAHMWFGDLVTMRWWDDLWLKESFATFASYLCQAEATRWGNAWTTFTQFWKGLAYRADQLPDHPSDRGRHHRLARGRGELRRDHLCEGRIGAEAARRVRWPGQLHGGPARLLRAARMGQRHARRPAVRAGTGVRAGPDRVVARLAAHGRGEYAAPVLHG